jgi:hypothetical protein
MTSKIQIGSSFASIKILFTLYLYVYFTNEVQDRTHLFECANLLEDNEDA